MADLTHISSVNGGGHSRGKRSREEANSASSNINNNNKNPTNVDVDAKSFLDSLLIDPDFEELSRQFPDFGRAYRLVKEQASKHGRSFSSCITQEFSIALTKALLRIHWGISLTDLPQHHLCPPVPNRYFLVQWLQRDLLPCLESKRYFTRTRRRSFSGLDIGTGATCIYPLLFVAAARKSQKLFSPMISSGLNHNSNSNNNQHWRIWAADIDPEAISLAEANVRSNQLQRFIQPLLVPPTETQQQSPPAAHAHTNTHSHSLRGPLYQSLQAMANLQKNNGAASACATAGEPPELDFCLTNPPFYSDDQECVQLRQGDKRHRTAMTTSEGTYPLGEVGFCIDILRDQCILYAENKGHLIPGWNVIMCGKKTSFVTLHHVVTQILGFSHVCCTEFGPGQLTRWFLAWTWQTRPCPKCPLASTDTWELEVQNNNVSSKELVERVMLFAQEFSLKAKLLPNNKIGGDSDQIIELWQNDTAADSSSSNTGLWMEDDQKLPASINQVLHSIPTVARGELLPQEGNFILTVQIRKPQCCPSKTMATPPTKTTTIQVKAFMHTTYGKRAVAKLKQQMTGEILRTNRKWRRQLKRLEELQAHQVNSNSMEVN